MSNILIKNTPRVDVGLTTSTFTIPTAGIYYVSFQCSEVPPSGLTVVVNNNGSPIFTAPVITPTQIALQFKINHLFAATDVVTIVTSSASAIDSQLNTVKTSVSIGQGE